MSDRPAPSKSVTWLLSRTVIVAIAALGGIAAIAAMTLQARRRVPGQWPKWLNWMAYSCMGVSVALFIASGLLNARPG